MPRRWIASDGAEEAAAATFATRFALQAGWDAIAASGTQEAYMRKLILPLIAVLTLAACNTMEGMGRDVSAAGDAVTDEAQEAQ